MNIPTIHQDTEIRGKFHNGKSRKAFLGSVKEVVIHGTGGGGTLEYVRGGGRAEYYYKGIALFHYLVETDGTIWEIIDPDMWVYHSTRGIDDRNSIGIEIENPDRLNRAEYKKEQYDSLNWLIYKHLMGRYPKIDTILSHRRAIEKRYNGTRTKECPGKGFDWSKLEDYMTKNFISFQHFPGIESYWNIKDLIKSSV